MKLKRLGVLVVGGALLFAPVGARAEGTTSTSVAGEGTLSVPASEGPEAVPDRSTEAELGGDGRRALGRFVPNLGRNFVGVFARESLRPLLVGAALTGAGSFLDGSAKNYVAKDRPFPALGRIGQTAGGAGLVAPLGAMMFVAGRVSHDGRFRAATYDALQATIVSQAYTFALKSALHRTRPDGSDHLSFPSGHASNAFAWATVASHYYGPKAGVAAYTAAGLIGLSRVDKNKHHVSDVLAGATLGCIVGKTILRENGEPVRSRRQLFVTPATDAQGSGLGLQLSLQF